MIIMNYNFDAMKIDSHFVSGFNQKRDCFSQIQNYINSENHQSKICAIYGLRRTGKTTLLKQAIENLSNNQKNKSIFITCYDQKTDFYDVIQYMKEQIENGYQYFFIDEITYADGFQNVATVLSDVFVNLNHVKIIITGTDSLGLSLVSHHEMYDRIEFVNTTQITYAEYSRLTGTNNIDDFIKKGSTLRTNIFDSKKSTDQFIETAIVNNIIHSLKKSENLRNYPAILTEKYSQEVLKNEIERIINRYSQVRTYQAIKSQFKSAPLGDARDTILKHDEDGLNIIAKLKYQETNKKIAEILGCDKPSGIEDKDISKIYDYLKEIGVFITIPVFHSYIKQESDEPLEMITHPGMFHSNIKYTIQELMKDSSWIEADQDTRQKVAINAYRSAMGKIMENIIISDVYYMLCKNQDVQKEDLFGEDTGRWYVSKVNCDIDGRSYEADIIIFDKIKKETYLFEIKHSSENVELQSKHLEDDKFLSYIEENFGPIQGRAVLYNGKTDYSTQVPRISAATFLKKIYQDSQDPNFSFGTSYKEIELIMKQKEQELLKKKQIKHQNQDIMDDYER